MKLSKGQERDLNLVMAFWSLPIVPYDSDIKEYLDWQERGVKPNTYKSPLVAELILCRSLAYGEPYSLEENLWVEGHFSGDYSLGEVVQNYIREGIGNPQQWFRRLPAYEMAYRLHMKLKGGMRR